MSQALRQTILLGDIGGTHARFAVLECGRLTPLKSLLVADYPDLRRALTEFLACHNDKRKIEGAILAVAGPVENGHCVLTNSSWVIDRAALVAAFGFADVHLVNDFEAIAWALPCLTENDVFALGEGKAVRGAPAAVLGPGTGLGLACLLPSSNGIAVVATEGGHATLAATSSREDTILQHLRNRFGHVSAERALSGSGLENLYDAIRTVDRIAAPDRSAAEITTAAVSGNCPASVAALDMFCAMLGTVAGNAALTFAARGGVYIGGGIVSRIAHYLARSEFRSRFEAKGRLRSYLNAIPSNIIIHPDPAFIGLQMLAERHFGAKIV